MRGLKILILNENAIPHFETKNITYGEVFENLDANDGNILHP